MLLQAKMAGEAIANQASNAFRLATRRPVTLPPLESATLDPDDVEIALEWLEQPGTWQDGTTVREFEEAFAEWNGSGRAWALMSGREALTTAIHGLGLRPGDEVIIPGFTCVVVPNAFQFEGITVRFADIELDTFGMEYESFSRLISDRTRAVLVHHLFGLVARDAERIMDQCRKRGLRVIEDCAHAAGAGLHGKKAGNFGDVAFYSTEQSKVMNSIMGGVVVTNDDEISERIEAHVATLPYPAETFIRRHLHNVPLGYYKFKHPARWFMADYGRLKHGRFRIRSTTAEEIDRKKPEYYGRRMPAPVAALALNQLSKIDGYNARRRRTASRWDEWCDRTGRRKPLVVEHSRPVFLRYPVMVEPERKRHLAWAERELGVRPGVWFKTHLHPAPGTVPGCPNADRAVASCINLPTLLD